jgi:guanidinopropionase
MNTKKEPMVPNRRSSMPVVYGDTPSFLGCPILKGSEFQSGYDVLFIGVPWEGTITWGSFSGCELAPRTIRHAAARYGGFLPEHEIDFLDYLRIGDVGDIGVEPNDPEKTMKMIFDQFNVIYQLKSVPFTLGGDHSFTPEIIRALSKNIDGQIGVIHFDSHFDNSDCFGEDRFPRCSPLYRISQIPKVRRESIVHLGIRGPRNSPAQMEYARSIGSRVFTIKDIRRRGIESVITEAVQIAKYNTQYLYVTICSDILDAACNPGGPADFNGLLPHELFHSLFTLGESGIDGLDYVEVYPLQDPNSFSSHLAAWALIYALAGMASRKRQAAALHNRPGNILEVQK